MKPINVEKSIEKNKIVFYEDWLDKLVFLFEDLFIFLISFVIPVLLFLWLYKDISVFIAFLFLVFGLSFSFFILYSLLNNRKLKKIKRKPKANIKHVVSNYIKEKNWKVLVREKNYIKVNVHDKNSGFHCGRNMYIIFSENDILINSSTIGHSGNLLPYHWFGNRRIENEFRKEFELYEK